MVMHEEEKRLMRCCFTGHRPEKLDLPADIICDKLKRAVEFAIGQGKKTFVCGMARGIDLWAGQVVIQKKRECPDIKLICATPYLGFERRWDIDWQKIYASVASHADYKVALSKQYDPSCFQRRNEWMVTHSSMVIAAYNGKQGGTRNTIHFATECGIPVYNILNFALDI